MYKATIAQVSDVADHPNADRLRIANVLGYQVIVGLDTKAGDIGILFPSDGQLSIEYASANNLVRKIGEDGVNTGGLFEQNRRVKATNIRGVKSYGYFADLSSLEFTKIDTSKLRVGDEIDVLGGIPICNKYYTPATVAAMRSGRAKGSVAETTSFKRHKETYKLLDRIALIRAGARITITEKVHGTSHRHGNVQVVTENNWLRKLLRLKPRTEWREVSGTRNVISTFDATRIPVQGLYRQNSVSKLMWRLRKGEIVYFEIAGYEDGGKPIMSAQSTKPLKDKEISRRYGDTMTYSYGCERGQCEVFVYRITLVNDDGVELDYPWDMVKERCLQLGVKHVPEYADFIYDGNSESLVEMASGLTDGPSTIDGTHIREGVVVRVDSGSTVFLKHKSFTFLVLEGVAKEQDSYVDTEEVS